MKFVLLRKTSIAKTVAATTLIAVLAVSVFLTDSAPVYAGNAPGKLPIYCVDTTEKEVALTFDAAWGAEKTPKILDALTLYDIRATFFVVGFWAEKYSAELKALSESGRAEIGTHSNTHPHLPKLTKTQMELELTTSCNIIESVTGKRPDLFRPPFGDYDNRLIETCAELKLYPIQWDVDSLDWKGLSATAMAERVLSRVKSGSIILMHNDGENTVSALPLIITGLKNKGYTFKTVGELIYRDGYTIDRTGKQIKAA